MPNNIEIKFGDFQFDDNGNNIVISKISAKESLPVKTTDIPKMDGAVSEEAKRSVVSISVEGHVTGEDYDHTLDKLDTLKGVLYAGKQKFTTDRDRYIYAQMKTFQEDKISLHRLVEFKATFEAEYPYWRSEDLRNDKRTPTSGTGYIIYNKGNAPARVKVSLVAPAGGISDDIQIENITRSETMKFRGTVAASEELIVDNRVDSDDDFVVTNDGDDAHQYFEGDFLVLDPGKNEIEYTGTAGAIITLSWRDTWL